MVVVVGSLERFSKGGYGISDIYNFPKHGGPGANFLIWAFLTK